MCIPRFLHVQSTSASTPKNFNRHHTPLVTQNMQQKLIKNKSKTNNLFTWYALAMASVKLLLLLDFLGVLCFFFLAAVAAAAVLSARLVSE